MSESRDNYSHEAFDEAEHAEQKAKEDLHNHSKGHWWEADGYGRKYYISSASERRWKEAQSKLTRLREAAHSEAMELNQRYDELIQDVVHAQEALRRFENEQLGIADDLNQ